MSPMPGLPLGLLSAAGFSSSSGGVPGLATSVGAAGLGSAAPGAGVAVVAGASHLLRSEVGRFQVNVSLKSFEPMKEASGTGAGGNGATDVGRAGVSTAG